MEWVHDQPGGRCCALGLPHPDGWASWYLHLGNDTPGTDDGQGWGFAEGVVVGVSVTTGQVIEYVGDSGNAEDPPPHPHFELHAPGPSSVVDPFPFLQAAGNQPVTGPGSWEADR